MRILIIESCEKVLKEKVNSSIVHVRNSILLRDSLGIDLVSHVSEIDEAMKHQYDAIICAYASPYMKYDSYLTLLDNNPNAKLYWLVNDHDVEDNILLRKWILKYNKPFHMICNNPREGYRGWILRKILNEKTLNDWIDEWHTVNLNVLIFNEEEFKKPIKNKKDIIYYGTFRKHRIDDLLKYNNINYHLSSSKKNHDKFSEAGVTARFIDRLQWEDLEEDLFGFDGVYLKDYKYSLYVEDKHTHDNYAFMANRFYECVMSNTILFYDANCQQTIKKSGYNISPFQIVNDGVELKHKLNLIDSDSDMYKTILEIQQSNVKIIKKERKNLLATFKEILS